MSELEIWPPQWKPFTECPQYLWGMIDKNIYELDIEALEDIGDLKKFLHQLRDSRGYDIDCIPPEIVSYSFWAEGPAKWKKDYYVKDGVQFAFNEINAQAQKHGEMYELQDIVRVVENLPHRCILFTFNVREAAPSTDVVKTVQAMVYMETFKRFELFEWRFRPGPPETPPETPREISPEENSSSNDSDDTCDLYDLFDPNW